MVIATYFESVLYEKWSGFYRAYDIAEVKTKGLNKTKVNLPDYNRKSE